MPWLGGPAQPYTYAGSGSGSPVPQASYASPAPTQVQANPIAYSGGGTAHSVTNTGHSTYSDPYARQQSQGFRPRPCGPGGGILDTLFNIRDAGQAVIDGVNDFVRDPEAAFYRLADRLRRADGGSDSRKVITVQNFCLRGSKKLIQRYF